MPEFRPNPPKGWNNKSDYAGKPAYSSKPKKPKPWSHQDDLASYKGREIVLHLMSGDSTMGTLIDADQFTVKVRVRGGQSVLTIYKHALMSYFVE